MSPLRVGALVLGLIGAPAGGADAPPPWREPVLAAEQAHALPPGLLARVIGQESGFDPNARSPQGAIGIAQIVPRWHPGVDPRDPHASIEYAAGYLSRLEQQTGSWVRAVMAYNWGIGNLQKYGPDRAPLETLRFTLKVLHPEL